MADTPTRGAERGVARQWVRKPMLAGVVKLCLFLVPIGIGWLAVRLTEAAYVRPAGWVGTFLWIVQAFFVCGVVVHVASRVVERVAPITALLNLNLIFPENAPSRFRSALRAGTVRNITSDDLILSSDRQRAAEQAIELIVRLTKHERLTRGHTERVRAYADVIGQEMGLSEADLEMLRWGVLLHDIGKLAVPAEILRKEGRPTDAEWEIIKTHPAAGMEILEPLHEWLGEWLGAAGEHHERLDGEGYPNGLKGREISLAGRITAVADAFDVITSKRSYKEPMSEEAARRELVSCAGTQFDPKVVRALLQAGVSKPRPLGLFSWILELQTVGTAISYAGSAPVIVASTMAIGIASVTAGSVPEPPPQIAFVEPTSNVESFAEDSSTVAPAPSSAETNGVVTSPSSSTIEAPLSTDVANPDIAPLPDVSTSSTTSSSSSTTTPRTATVPSNGWARHDIVTGENDGNIVVRVLTNDSPPTAFDPTTLSVVEQSDVGTTTVLQNTGNPAQSHIRFRSNSDFVGVTAFSYEICDISGDCATATVSMTITPALPV